MVGRIRRAARHLLGVRRSPTYYLPWIARPDLACVLLLNNVEMRLSGTRPRGPFAARVTRYDARGVRVAELETSLADCTDTVEVPLDAREGLDVGFVTVAGDVLTSDLYVALTDGGACAVTHGRFEFIEEYPRRARALLHGLGALLALVGHTVPAFGRDQFVYTGPDHRAHVLLLNLSDVVNRLRVTARADDGTTAVRLLRLPPRGAHLLEVTTLGPPAPATRTWRLRLVGNAWFNLYLVGAGPRDLAGPLSLMHVK
jgi:hypothetical protein